MSYTRHRSRVIDQEFGMSYQTSHSNPAHASSSGSFPDYPVMGKSEEMWDVVTSRFPYRIRRGEIIINPMRKREVDYSIVASEGMSRSDISGCTLSHDTMAYMIGKSNADMYPALTPVYKIGADKDRVINLAATQAWGAVSEAEFETLVFLGELRETLHMLKHPLGKVDAKMRSYEDKATRVGLSVGKYIRDQWLSIRYGWRPLLSELSNAVEAVDSLRKKKPPRITARGYAETTELVDNPPQSIWAGSYNCSYDTAMTIDYSVRAGIIYEIDYRNPFGLTIMSVPSTVWELVPYSFVADWFVNIGDYIKAITPVPGVNVLGSYYTSKEIWKSTVEMQVTAYPGKTIYNPGLARATAEVVETNRVVGLPKPSLSFKLSFDDFDLKTAQIIDAVALISQRLKI